LTIYQGAREGNNSNRDYTNCVSYSFREPPGCLVAVPEEKFSMAVKTTCHIISLRMKTFEKHQGQQIKPNHISGEIDMLGIMAVVINHVLCI
jgi:hypothetical protein